jgi:hypothetical protein
LSAVGRNEVGSPGIPGVVETTFDASLVPALLLALTLNEYVVALVRPVTVALVDVETPSLNVDQVEPEFEENSIR